MLSNVFVTAQNPIPIPSIANLSQVVGGSWYVGFFYSENYNNLFGVNEQGTSLASCFMMNITFDSFEGSVMGVSISYQIILVPSNNDSTSSAK